MIDLIACMPQDRSGLPAIPELDAIVITDLYVADACQKCGQAIWVGPRQSAAHSLEPERYAIVCFECAAAIAGPDPGVVQLGGGYGVEGRRR